MSWFKRIVLAAIAAASMCAFGQTAHPLAASDIEAFLDGLMPQQLAREDIAGAVVLVVKDGKILFDKGYGFADVAKRKPVTPDATLFRPGSISKLFTWTAVMQLVEQNKLSLDQDVNTYLDFPVSPAFGKPITLRNIMTHTAGFEETVKELFVASPSQVKPLGEYLRTHMPQRVYPPGTTPAYSNYATAMAGYIVQRVSGQPYDEYIENHILKPLGMQHTTFRQPLPEALKPMMSEGYTVASKPAKHFEVVQPFPAGSSSVTAEDMARLMIAHLQDGEYQGQRILQPATAQLMHARQFENHPQMNAMALGFYEESRNGMRIIGHGGDTVCFHSDLHLVPSQQLGFFVSYNSAGKGEINPRGALWEAFLDRYFPYTPAAGGRVADAVQDRAMIAGRYISSRRSVTNLMAVLTVASQPRAYSNADGTVSVTSLKDMAGHPKHFEEIAPLLFREVHGQSKIAFKRDDSGRLVVSIDYPFMVFSKAGLLESSGFNTWVLIFGLGTLCLTVLLWPVAALVRRHYGKRLPVTPSQRVSRLLVRVVCSIDIAFALAWVVLLSTLNDPVKLNPGLDPLLRVIQLVGWLGVAGTLWVLYDAFLAWTHGNSWWKRLHAAALVVATVGLTWFIFQWHLLHWSLNY